VGFVERVFALRRSVPELRRDDFYYGHSGLPDGEVPDIVWLSESARELGPEDWATPLRTLVVRVRSASPVLVVLHAAAEPVEVVLPGEFGDAAWSPVLDSGAPDGEPADGAALAAGTAVAVPGQTFLVFRAV
jgi:glycogen operon protein